VPEKYRDTYTNEDALMDAEFMALRQEMGFKRRGQQRRGGAGRR